MTSIGIQCNIEQSSGESSSTSQSATGDARIELYHDNDDRNLEKSDLAQILNRSEPDGVSLSQMFNEGGETSIHRTTHVQDAPQEATINSEPSDPTFSPKKNREDNVSTQNPFITYLAVENKTGKQKPCAVVTPFPRQSVTSDEEETIIKTSFSGDGEEGAIVSHPNMAHSIISQRVGCLEEALHQESEQLEDIAEEIDFAQTSTEHYFSQLSCPLLSVKLIQVSGDKNISINMKNKVNGESDHYSLDGALRELTCDAIKSHTKSETQIVPQDGDNKSAQENTICKDIEGDEESSSTYQHKLTFVIQIQTSDNIVNEDIKGQKVQSQCEQLAEKYNEMNRNGRMKQRSHMARFRRRSRSHTIELRRPLHTMDFTTDNLDKYWMGHIRNRKIKGNDGNINNLPPKVDRSTVKLKTRGKSGLKYKKNCNLLGNKDSLNRIYLRPTRDKFTKSNGNDISLKLKNRMKMRQKSQKLKKTPTDNIRDKQNIRSRNKLTKGQKVRREKQTVNVRFKNKDYIQIKPGHTNKATCVIDNQIIKYVYVYFYSRQKHRSKTTMSWHNLYSSIKNCVKSDLCQLTVAPVGELTYCAYFSIESHRRQSFRTYDNQDIVERLVRNGFFYSEIEKKIICYKCGGNHGRLCDGDVPERVHRSGCQFRHATDTGIHSVIPERSRTRISRDDLRMQSSSNPTQTSSSWHMANRGPEQIPNTRGVSLSYWTLGRFQDQGHTVPGSGLQHGPQAIIDYFRRQNESRGRRGGRSITVIPPFPFDEIHERRRHITVLPPRQHMNGGRRIIALPPRPQLDESVSPANGTVNRTESVTGAEAIPTPSMRIFLPHKCVFCRRRPVSIRFEPCQHALACYQCSLGKVICTQCGKIIMHKSFMQNTQ